MNHNIKFYVLIGCVILSYAYCFENYLLPGIIMAFTGLFIALYFNKDRSFNYANLLLYAGLVLLFEIMKIEDYYSGFKIIGFINIISSLYINRIFSDDFRYENKILKWLSLYMVFILVSLILNSSNIMVEVCVISTIFLPLIIQFYSSRVRINGYKGKSHDTIFNKQIH